MRQWPSILIGVVTTLAITLAGSGAPVYQTEVDSVA